MNGKFNVLPRDIIKDIRFNNMYIETDEFNAAAITEAVVNDHELFLSPMCLAADKLLSFATYMFAKERGDTDFVCDLVDFELLNMLKKSALEEVEEILEVLLYQPNRIRVSDISTKGSLELGIRKLYIKTPLVNGEPFIDLNQEAKGKLESLNRLKKTYYVSIK